MIQYPNITPLAERRFRLNETVHIQLKSGVWTITAPWIYDGASIPRPVWSLVGLYPGGVMEEPALWHDSFYRAAGVQNGIHMLTRHKADLIFRQMMREYSIPMIRAQIAYIAVYTCGRRHWGGPSPY